MPLFRFVAVIALALALTNVAAMQQSPLPATSHCDPSLASVPETANGYRLRGDRCEGIYVRDVGASMVVASFTEAFEFSHPQARQPLRVQWDAPDGATLRLRARGLRRRLHYRMDTSRTAATSYFDWPTDVLSSLELTRRDVGIVGLTSIMVGPVRRDVYVPLRVGPGAAPAGAGAYTLALMSDVELREVFVTLVATNANGGTARVVKNGQPLGYGYYPPERPIELTIDNLPMTGVYHLEIGAMLQNGGSTAIDLWFVHSRR